MRRLLLLRHAKTKRESPTGLDRDRRLEARGRHDALSIGKYLVEHRLVPALALVSPAARTVETFELLSTILDPAPVTRIVPGLYEADPSDLLDIIRDPGQANGRPAESLLIVAHNPALHELALELTGDGTSVDRQPFAEDFPTSGLAVVSFAVGDWSDVSPHRGTLERFVSPALL